MQYTRKYTKRGRKTQTNLPLIQSDIKHKRSLIHCEILYLFARILDSLKISFNIDHITPACRIDKSIPLRDRNGKKYDLSFLWDNHLVLIEVKTIKLTQKR